MRFSIESIKEKFSYTGREPEDQSWVLRPEDRSVQRRRAAVLLPIILPSEKGVLQQAEDVSVLFTRRSFDLRYHPGQISFPGGSVDVADKTIADTALRETFEEVGISSRYVEVLGTFESIVTTTNFEVTPVVGLLDRGFTVLAQPEEVEEVFTVPFRFLMNQENHHWHSPDEMLPVGKLADKEWLSIDYEDGGQLYQIWGATASIVLKLYEFLNSRHLEI